LDPFEILVQDVDMLFDRVKNKNLQLSAQIKSYILMLSKTIHAILAIPASLGHLLLNTTSSFEIWHVSN